MQQHPLVDHELIAQAREHHAAQVKRLAAAREQATAAGRDRDAALSVRTDAIEGRNDVNPLDAERDVETAERAHRVAALVIQAADRSVKEAEDGQRAAEGRAWRPVYLDGVRRRVAAARAGEAARKALEAADTEHAEATLLLDQAVNHGTVGVEYVHQRLRQLTTEADELKLWTSNGFDPVEGKYLHWI